MLFLDCCVHKHLEHSWNQLLATAWSFAVHQWNYFFRVHYQVPNPNLPNISPSYPFPTLALWSLSEPCNCLVCSKTWHFSSVICSVGVYETKMDKLNGFPFSLTTRIISDSWQYPRKYFFLSWPNIYPLSLFSPPAYMSLCLSIQVTLKRKVWLMLNLNIVFI